MWWMLTFFLVSVAFGQDSAPAEVAIAPISPIFEIEPLPTRALSLVRGGVELHRFRIGGADLPVLAIGAGLALGLQAGLPTEQINDGPRSGTAALAALPALAVGIVPLERPSNAFASLRNLGRTAVVFEPAFLAFAGGLLADDTPGVLDAVDRRHAIAASTSALAFAYTTTVLRSRKRRGFAFDGGLAGYLGAAAAAGGYAALCGAAIDGAEDTDYPATFGLAAGGAALGVALPLLHLKASEN